MTGIFPKRSVSHWGSIFRSGPTWLSMSVILLYGGAMFQFPPQFSKYLDWHEANDKFWYTLAGSRVRHDFWIWEKDGIIEHPDE